MAWSKPGSYRAFSYDAADQLVADGLGAYAYDVDGNLTHDSGGRDYAWDAANRLVQAQVPVPNSSAKAFHLDYAANNLRVRKTDNGGAVTNYLYDGLQLLAETDASGAVKKLYNPGVSVTDNSGNKFYYLINGHGDTADLIDRDGNIVDAYSYDAFGATVGGANSNGLRYVSVGGVYSDDELGLQYMWNRWYDPELGRSISRDPIGFAGGSLDLYSYARNNPLSYSDPLGLWTFSVGGVQSGGVVVGGGKFSGIIFGYFSSSGFQAGTVESTGYGGAGGIYHAFAGLGFSISSASDISMLSGPGGEGTLSGGEGAVFGGILGGGNGYVSFGGIAGLGGGLTPANATGYKTNTNINPITGSDLSDLAGYLFGSQGPLSKNGGCK